MLKGRASRALDALKSVGSDFQALEATLTALSIDYNDEMSMKGLRMLSDAFGAALVD